MFAWHGGSQLVACEWGTRKATTIPQLCVRGPGPSFAELSRGPCLTLQGELDMRDTDCCGRVAEKPASEPGRPARSAPVALSVTNFPTPCFLTHKSEVDSGSVINEC